MLTHEDYAALPADGRRYELHKGELSVTPAPSPMRQRAVLNIAALLHSHVKAKGSGQVLIAPLDVILSDRG